jgi:hypothetical protein
MYINAHQKEGEKNRGTEECSWSYTVRRNPPACVVKNCKQPSTGLVHEVAHATERRRRSTGTQAFDVARPGSDAPEN